MINLMIVDDELIIRQGLKKAADWEKYGIRIVAEAKDAHSALEKAINIQPDIIICDIRLADENGLDFVRSLKKQLSDVKIIMLSGYSNTNYMMDAIHLGVQEYLLKPAGADIILSTVLRLRDEIIKHRENIKQSTQREHVIAENMETLQEHFIRDLLSGTIPQSQIQPHTKVLNISLPGPFYQLLTISVLANGEWPAVQLLSLKLSPWSPVFSWQSQCVTAILNVNEELQPSDLNFIIADLQTLIFPTERPCLSPICSLEDISLHYSACKTTMTHSIWIKEPILFASQQFQSEELPQEKLLDYERKIVESIRTHNSTSYTDNVEALFLLFEKYQPPEMVFRKIILEIARSVQIFTQNTELLQTLEPELNSAYQVSEIKSIFLNILHHNFLTYGPQINSALQYIQKNCNSDISLSDVASTLFISSSYLSRLLKNKTSKGFNEWLHFMRIEKAKDLLLHSNLRHYEIAEMVGYHSYKIFNEYFNKIVGCSAKTFREQQSSPKNFSK